MATATNHGHAVGFLGEVLAATPGVSRLEMCIQCGTCGGSCPSGADMDHTPRRLFAMIAAEMKKEVLRSNTPWYCVSCYYCTVRCPQEIHITDVMYSLKQMAIKEGFSSQGNAPAASDFSETFISNVEKNGRSFEFGLATRYHLAHHPLEMVKMASMGLGMFQKGRLDIRPKKIKQIDQLQSILAKAKELEG